VSTPLNLSCDHLKVVSHWHSSCGHNLVTMEIWWVSLVEFVYGRFLSCPGSHHWSDHPLRLGAQDEAVMADSS